MLVCLVQETVDVAVVGASPAGLSAAQAAASRGLEVVLLEAGGIGEPEPPAVVGFDHAWPDGLELPSRVLRTRFDWVRLSSPGGHGLQVHAPGRIVHRTRLDRWLAERARRAGVEVVTELGLCQVEQPGRISHARGRTDARVVVFADGPRSIAGALLDPVCSPDRLVWGVTHELDLPTPPAELEITIGSHAPGGRTQVLPIGASTVWHWTFARRPREKALELADRALEIAADRHGWPQASLEEAVRRHVAPDPVFQHPGRLADDRTLVAGGAGGLGGLEAGLASGTLAGQAASRAIERDQVGRDALAGYEQACLERFGPAYEGLAQLMRVAERTPDAVFDALIRPWEDSPIHVDGVAGLALDDPFTRMRTLAGIVQRSPVRAVGSLAGAAVACLSPFS